MWEEAPSFPPLPIPRPYALTADRGAMQEAVAVVFHLPSLPAHEFQGKLTKRRGQLWIAWYMECEAHYPQLADPDFMSRFDLTMSYRLNSDIAAPYVDPCLTQRLRAIPATKKDGNLLNAFISSRHDRSKRFELLLQLMAHIDVHSYGKILQNKRLPNDLGFETKLEVIGSYKFTLACENAIAQDYVTEKFFHPLIVGSVPVYLGAPNIDAFAPGDNCFINAADWESPAALARYLLEIAADDRAYAGLLAWKTKPFRPEFSRLLEKVQEHPFVRLCKKVDERLR
jgi:hypothetical protein